MQETTFLASSVATLQCKLDKKFLLPGNITPHLWYKKFCDEKGNPDLLAITAFSEVFAWCRNGTHEYYGVHMPKFDGISLSISYEYFNEKFGFNKERVRRAFVRLEKFGVLKRDVRNIELLPGVRVNRLFITIDENFFNSCFRDPNLDIRVGEGNSADTLPNSIFSNGGQRQDSRSLSLPSPHKCGDLLSNKNINKDRSMKSNFLKNSFFKKREDNLRVQHYYTTASPQIKAPILQLKDFYPLSENDAKSLQKYSGREFSLNAMNEILLDMSNRVKDRWFKSKKGFLSYMSLVFKHEMRDAVKVSSVNFKIRANQTVEEVTHRKQEEFLKRIEYSLQVSPEWHLKKKLCSVLESDKAYNLLMSYRESRMYGDIFKIYLTKHVELSGLDRKIILDQVKASHDKINPFSLEGEGAVKLEIIMPEKNLTAVSPKFKRQGDNSNFPKENIESIGLWGRIRKAFIMYHGENGALLDLHWLSKLTPEVNEEQKTIKLIAPNNFIRDWVQSNYSLVLKKISRRHDYAYVIC